MHLYKTLMIYVFLCICNSMLIAQNALPKIANEQTKFYQAKINDINDLAVTLTFNGSKCIGLAQYVRSKESFRLNGTLQNGKIRLTEIDRKGAVSGSWFGEQKDKNFNITWLNHNNTIGNTITLTETTQQLTEPTNCAANKWIHRYEGSIALDNFEMIIQRIEKNQIVGIAYFNKKALSIKGDIIEDVLWELTLTDENGNQFGKLRGSKPFNEEWRMMLSRSDTDTRLSAILKLKDNISVECIEYADYFISYDAIFPILESKQAVNTTWHQPVEDWLRECRTESEKLKQKYHQPTPTDRCAARGSAWCEIDWWDEAIWSARFTTNQTWSPAKTIPINVDLTKDEAITLSQIFKKDEEMQILLRKHVGIALNGAWKDKEKTFKTWILQQDFSKIFNIRRGGLTFSTPFHATYGQQHIEIPYPQLKHFIKKDSPIAYLAK
jgi:hypothetical protein